MRSKKRKKQKMIYCHMCRHLRIQHRRIFCRRGHLRKEYTYPDERIEYLHRRSCLDYSPEDLNPLLEYIHTKEEL